MPQPVINLAKLWAGVLLTTWSGAWGVARETSAQLRSSLGPPTALCLTWSSSSCASAAPRPPYSTGEHTQGWCALTSSHERGAGPGPKPDSRLPAPPLWLPAVTREVSPSCRWWTLEGSGAREDHPGCSSNHSYWRRRPEQRSPGGVGARGTSAGGLPDSVEGGGERQGQGGQGPAGFQAVGKGPLWLPDPLTSPGDTCARPRPSVLCP